MREDLPCEERLPKLWSISLATGGDLIDAGPRLEEFDVLEPLQLGESRRRCWRVQGKSTDNQGSSDTTGGGGGGGSRGDRNVLCEFRYRVRE